MHEHDDLARTSEVPVPSLPEVTVATWIQKGQESLRQTNTNINATRHFSTVHSASWSFIMADNKKQERDFTIEVDALLPDAQSIAKV
jgi:26S proteasome regulatory subunit N5